MKLWFVPGQAYRHWKKSNHEYFFISNNDVLVPDGALTSLMHVMRDGGAPPATLLMRGKHRSRVRSRGRLSLALPQSAVLTSPTDHRESEIFSRLGGSCLAAAVCSQPRAAVCRRPVVAVC
jgi:hypothetical protein